VDKLVGRALLDGSLPLSAHVLHVSGRISFEIVQKAAVAGVPVLAAVSAPSSLAMETAEHVGMTMVGFLRGETFNVYTHPERIEGSSRPPPGRAGGWMAVVRRVNDILGLQTRASRQPRLALGGNPPKRPLPCGFQCAYTEG